MTALRVVAPRGYGCPDWCEVGGGHESNDGAGGPFWHTASRSVPYRAAVQFIVAGEKCRNPLGVTLERAGDGPAGIVLCNEDEPVPVLVNLTVAEAADLAARLTELVTLARR
jgi:hypothetical protein